MHLASVAHGHYGSYVIIGAHLPIATGMAWSARVRGTDQVVVCFFGDGATNIGAFHEAVNLAALWSLPVLFVCENNQYSEWSSYKDVTPVGHPAADRSPAYGLDRHVIDGNDVEAVMMMAMECAARARSGGGPSLIEALTYRHHGHSLADPGRYRPPDEVAEWKGRDPVRAYRAALEGRGVSAAELERIYDEIKADVKAAADLARNDPPPEPAALYAHVWADGGSTWRS